MSGKAEGLVPIRDAGGGADVGDDHGAHGVGEAGSLGEGEAPVEGGEEGPGEAVAGAGGVDGGDGEGGDVGGGGALVDDAAAGAEFEDDVSGAEVAEGGGHFVGGVALGGGAGFVLVHKEEVAVGEGGGEGFDPFGVGGPAGVDGGGESGGFGAAELFAAVETKIGEGEDVGLVVMGDAGGDVGGERVGFGEDFVAGADVLDELAVAGAVHDDDGGCGGGDGAPDPAGVDAGGVEFGEDAVAALVGADHAEEAGGEAEAGHGVGGVGAVAAHVFAEVVDPIGGAPAELFDGADEDVVADVAGDEDGLGAGEGHGEQLSKGAEGVSAGRG